MPLPEQEPLHKKLLLSEHGQRAALFCIFGYSTFIKAWSQGMGTVSCFTPGSCVPSYPHNPTVSRDQERCILSQVEASPCPCSSENGNKDFEARIPWTLKLDSVIAHI